MPERTRSVWHRGWRPSWSDPTGWQFARTARSGNAVLGDYNLRQTAASGHSAGRDSQGTVGHLHGLSIFRHGPTVKTVIITYRRFIGCEKCDSFDVSGSVSPTAACAVASSGSSDTGPSPGKPSMSPAELPALCGT